MSHVFEVAVATMVGTCIAGLLSAAAPTKSGVLGSVHNVGGSGCKSCHAPHNGSVATGGTSQTTGSILLWDRAFTSETFGVYNSPTLDSPTAEVGTTTPAVTEARLYSFICMSCHDGVTTPSLIGPSSKFAVGNPANSGGLSNDHPVNVLWNHQTMVSGQPPCSNCHVFHGTIAEPLPFYNQYLECTTCHEPHMTVHPHFLRRDNANSNLCLSCHG